MPSQTISDPLDPAEPVVDWDMRHPILAGLIKEWPTGDVLREEMYQRDLEANTQPPVMHVTVTPPEGEPAPEGYWEVTTGPQPVVTWRDGADTEPVRKVLPVTRAAADKVATNPHEWLLGDPEDETENRTADPD